MSLKRVAMPSMRDETQRVAQANFPEDAPLLRLHDALGPLYNDPLFADLFSAPRSTSRDTLAAGPGHRLPVPGRST
jgi:hypothetical protein